MLAGRMPPLSEPIPEQPDDVPTESIKPPDDTPEAGEDQTATTQKNTLLEHPETESDVSRKDPVRRKKNRMMGRDVLKASEIFRGGEG